MQILALLEGPLAAKRESRDLTTTSKLDPPITTWITISVSKHEDTLILIEKAALSPQFKVVNV